MDREGREPTLKWSTEFQYLSLDRSVNWPYEIVFICIHTLATIALDHPPPLRRQNRSELSGRSSEFTRCGLNKCGLSVTVLSII